MTNTRSGLTTQTTPMVAARHQKKMLQGTIINPPFRHCYFPPPNMCTPIHEASICEVTGDPQVAGLSGSTTGNNGEPPNDPSSSDTMPTPSTPSPNNTTLQGNAPNPRGKDPNPDDNPIPSDHDSFRSSHSQCSNVPEPTELLAQAMSKLVDFVTHDKQETPSAKVWDPDLFDSFDPKKLQGFLPECKLDFQARPKAFRIENAKVNYAMSFLKGMALDYFEPFLDTPDNEPAWLEDYKLFLEELLINFGPYNTFMDAEAELDVLIMKESHKATRFFIDFFRLSTLCDYNNRALLQKAYSMLLKRVKDEMTHFDRSSMLQELRDLVLRINQRYWEHKAELAHESGPTPQTNGKFGNKSLKPELANEAPGSKDNKRPKEQAQKRPDLTDKLGKDGKLTPQEWQ